LKLPPRKARLQSSFPASSREVRKALQNLVLVDVTGYGLESDRLRSQEAGFDHHLVKPVGFDTLLGLLATIVEARATDPQ
jgi:CheY-like chemotaxis protein